MILFYVYFLENVAKFYPKQFASTQTEENPSELQQISGGVQNHLHPHTISA